MFWARDFGAVADGQADDGPAIRAAMTAAKDWLDARRALGEQRDEVVVVVSPDSHVEGGVDDVPEGVVLRSESDAFPSPRDPVAAQAEMLRRSREDEQT